MKGGNWQIGSSVGQFSLDSHSRRHLNKLNPTLKLTKTRFQLEKMLITTVKMIATMLLIALALLIAMIMLAALIQRPELQVFVILGLLLYGIRLIVKSIWTGLEK